MKNNLPKFGLPYKEELYERYIDKHYIVHPIGISENYAGKIKDIDVKNGKITLNPYYGLNYNRRSDKNLWNLIEKDFDIFWDLTKISFEPTTSNALWHNCDLSNKERAEKSKLSFLKRFKLIYRLLINKID